MDRAITWHDFPDGADFYPTRMGRCAGFSIAVSQRAVGVIRLPRSVDGIALTIEGSVQQRKARRGRSRAGGRAGSSNHLIDAIAGLGLRGLDLEAVLLGGGREEAPDECVCQSVAFTISARVAPLGRPISSRIFAPLLSARGVLASLAWAGFGLLAGLGFLLRRGLGFAPWRLSWPLGAPFFWLAPFFEEAFSGATCAPCSATVAAFSVIVASAFVMVVNPFCA